MSSSAVAENNWRTPQLLSGEIRFELRGFRHIWGNILCLPMNWE